MRGYFVTGTDTDVGKTRVTAALARSFASAGMTPVVVKLVQTGRDDDALLASQLAGVEGRELARFSSPFDPWNAARHAGRPPLHAAALAAELATIPGPVVVEGSGGAAVPLNARETISDVALLAGLPAVIVVGLRLGCISHAVLTASYLRSRAIDVAGFVLVEAWEPAGEAYAADVRQTLVGTAPVIGALPYDGDAARTIARGAVMLAPLVAAARAPNRR